MKFANMIGYSDVTPYEVVRIVSDKTIEIREMKATLIEGWKPDMIAGGFSAHCANNGTQEYTYESDPEAQVIRARLNKNGKWKSVYGEHRIADKPKRFYDYNF